MTNANLTKQVAKQLGQVSEEVVKEIARQPKEIIKEAGQQLGGGGPVPEEKPGASQTAPAQQLAQAKAEDKAVTQSRIKELEAEIARLRQQREQQLAARRQSAMETASGAEGKGAITSTGPTKAMKSGLKAALGEAPTIKGRPKRFLGRGSSQVKRAQEKAGAETVVRRTSG